MKSVITIKVPAGLSGFLCLERQDRAVYQTNRAFKAYGVWLLLKSVTESGVIKDFEEQIAELRDLTGLSRSSLYRHLSWAEGYGLIRRTRKRLELCSYRRAVQDMHLQGNFIEVRYRTKGEQRIEDLLKALEYQEAREKMQVGLQAKVRKTPAISQAFKIQAMVMGKPDMEFTRSNLSRAQSYVFQKGGAAVVYEMLFVANPDFNRNLETIASRRKMKSHVSAFYERRMLAKAGLLRLTRRNPIVCQYKQDPVGSTRGKCDHRSRRYDHQRKITTWHLPVDIQVTLNNSDE